MTISFINRCVWRATSSGTGDFVVASAIPGHRVPADCVKPGIVDGGTYRYFAQSDDLSEWEIGYGPWNNSTSTLERAVVLDSSNSGSAVSFTAAPAVFMGAPLATDIQFKGHEEVTIDSSSSVEFDPNVLITYVTTNGLGAPNDLQLPNLTAIDAGTPHIIILQSKVDSADDLYLGSSNPGGSKLINEGDYGHMVWDGAKWNIVAAYFENDDGPGAFPLFQGLTYSGELQFFNASAFGFGKTSQVLNLDSTGGSQYADADVDITYINTDGLGADQGVLMPSPNLNNIGKRHLFLYNTRVDPADVAIVYDLNGDEIRLEDDDGYVLVECQNGTTWSIVDYKGVSQLADGDARVLTIGANGGLTWEVPGGGGGGGIFDTTTESIVTDNTSPYDAVDIDVGVSIITTDGSGLEQTVEMYYPSAGVAEGRYHLFLFGTQTDGGDIVRITGAQPYDYMLTNEGNYVLVQMRHNQWFIIAGYGGSFESENTAGFPVVLALRDDGNNEFVSAGGYYGGEEYVTFVTDQADAGLEVYQTFIVTNGNAEPHQLNISSDGQYFGMYKFIYLDSIVDPADIVTVAGSIEGGNVVLPVEGAWVLLRNIGTSWNLIAYGGGATQDEFMAYVEVRNANGSNISTPVPLPGTSHNLELSGGGYISAAMYHTYVTTEGTAGAESLELEDGWVGLNGARKSVIFDGQTDPADTVSFVTTNIVDDTGATPTSVIFDTTGQNILFEWQQWRDGNSGKWVIIGVSTGVVT